MKIADLKTYVLRSRLSETFGYSQYWYDHRTAMLLEVITDEGIIGWGEAYGPAEPISSIIQHFLKPVVIGEDPLDIERIWEKLYNRSRDFGQKGMPIAAISAVDVALWDILGKAVGLPVHKLLGGCLRDRIVAYATGLYFRKREDLPLALADEALKYVEEGFTAVKMKIGLSPREDIENVRAVRHRIGDGVTLMVDANHAYDSRTAIRLGRELEEFGPYWFEEPVPPEDIEGYREVKSALNMGIAGGECEFTRFGFRELISRRAVDIVQPDICSAGGLSECKKIAAMASAWGIRCIPHVWGSPIAIAASLHFLASLPDCPPSINPIPPMLEFDQTENPMREKLAKHPIGQEGGYVEVPKGPGLGIEIDRDVIRRYLVSN